MTKFSVGTANNDGYFVTFYMYYQMNKDIIININIIIIIIVINFRISIWN